MVVAGEAMYCDTCILVKLLTSEPDSTKFDEALRGQPLSTSELAYPEVCSALLAKERARSILPQERERAWKVFTDWIADEFLLIRPLNSATVRKAGAQLRLCHPNVALHTLDALHLASADLAQDFPLCTTDVRLRQAATLLGIPVFP